MTELEARIVKAAVDLCYLYARTFVRSFLIVFVGSAALAQQTNISPENNLPMTNPAYSISSLTLPPPPPIVGPVNDDFKRGACWAFRFEHPNQQATITIGSDPQIVCPK